MTFRRGGRIPSFLLLLIRGVTSISAGDRRDCADEAGYWALESYFDAEDQIHLAAIHAWAGLHEPVGKIRVELLMSFELLTLDEPRPIDLFEQVVVGLSGETLNASERETVDEFEARITIDDSTGRAPEDVFGVGGGSASMLELIRGLVSTSRIERGNWCTVLLDWGERMIFREASTVAAVLAIILASETQDVDIRRGMLESLLVLARKHHIRNGLMSERVVSAMNASGVQADERAIFRELLAVLA